MISRKTSALLGVLSVAAMAVVVMGFLIYFQLPAVVIAGGAVFVILVGGSRLLNIWRGSKERTQDYSTFESNKIAEPYTEEFHPAYVSDMPLESGEQVLAMAAPVMRVTSGFKDLFSSTSGSGGNFGVQKVYDADNAVLLTDKRLLFMMLGPDQVKEFAGDTDLVNVLEALPGDAHAKRRWLWLKGGTIVSEALQGLMREKDLAYIKNELFNYSVPLSDISGASVHPRSQGLKLKTSQKDLQHSFRNAADLAAFKDKLAGLGVSVVESNKMW
jgi:hypothetical protein